MEYMPMPGPPPPCCIPMPPGPPGPPLLFLGVAVLIRMGLLPQYTPCISVRAFCWSSSFAKRTNP